MKAVALALGQGTDRSRVVGQAGGHDVTWTPNHGWQCSCGHTGHKRSRCVHQAAVVDALEEQLAATAQSAQLTPRRMTPPPPTGAP